MYSVAGERSNGPHGRMRDLFGCLHASDPPPSGGIWLPSARGLCFMLVALRACLQCDVHCLSTPRVGFDCAVI